MATKKPRITITLEPEVYETLRDLAELQGRPLSSLVSDQLNLTHPVQQKVLAAVRNVFSIEAEARQDLADRLDSAQSQADASLGPLLALLDGFAEATQPPHSNTGVTLPNPPTPPNQKKPLQPSNHAASSGKKVSKEDRKAIDSEKMAETFEKLSGKRTA